MRTGEHQRQKQLEREREDHPAETREWALKDVVETMKLAFQGGGQRDSHKKATKQDDFR